MRTFLAQPAYDRPEPGLGRGKYPAPKWAIGLLAVAVVLGALVFLALRARRARRERKG